MASVIVVMVVTIIRIVMVGGKEVRLPGVMIRLVGISPFSAT